jgi:O-antigen ligase
MNASRGIRPYIFSILLPLALVAGMCFAWSPGYWAIFTAQAGIILVTVAWVLLEKGIAPSAEWAVVALVSFWGVFQILTGRTVSSWWTTHASLTWVSAGLSFFVASQVLRRRGNREVFLSILLWSSTALAFLSIEQAYMDPGRVFWMFPAENGSVGTFLYKNQFAALLELAAPIALYRTLSSGTRYAGAVAFTILFAAGVASVSRAGVILLTAELVFFLLFTVLRSAIRSKELTSKKCAGVVAVVAVLLVAGAAIGGPQALIDHFQDQNPYGIRFDLLQTTLHMAAAHPWFGFGMGTFRLTYPQYARFDLGVVVNAAHSDWAEWAVEGGFPFAALMAALLWMIGGRAIRSVWGIGVIAVALHSFIDYPTREPTIAFTWFAMMGALTVDIAEKRKSPPRGSLAVTMSRVPAKRMLAPAGAVRRSEA